MYRVVAIVVALLLTAVARLPTTPAARAALPDHLCSNFPNQAAAQAHYRADPVGANHGAVGHTNLDPRRTGIACQGVLPCPCDLTPVRLAAAPAAPAPAPAARPAPAAPPAQRVAPAPARMPTRPAAAPRMPTTGVGILAEKGAAGLPAGVALIVALAGASGLAIRRRRP